MEFILGTAVVVVLCLILQVDMGIILIGTTIIMGLGVALSLLTLFLYGLIIITSGRKKATLLRFETKEGQKRKSIIYEIEGREYRCAFPANPEKMYKKDKEHAVLLNRRLGWVFDAYSLITYVIWLISALILTVIWIKSFL